MTPYRAIPNRTLQSRDRSEIAALLRDHARVHELGGWLDGDRIGGLLDFAELHGSVISLRDGVRVELDGDSWLADLFTPRREVEAA